MFYIAIIAIGIAVGAMLLDPASAFLVAEFAKPIIDTTFDQPVIGGIPPTQIISGLVPLWIFLYILAGSRGDRAVSKLPLHVPWLVWLGYSALFSAVIAYNNQLFDGLNIFFRHANGFAGYYAVQSFFQDDRSRKRYLLVLLAAGVFPMSTAIYEAASGHHWHEVTDGLRLRNVGMYFDAIAMREYALQTLLALALYVSLYASRKPSAWIAALLYAAACLIAVYGVRTKAGTIVVASWALLWPLLRRSKYTPFAICLVALAGIAYLATDASQLTREIFANEVNALSGSDSVTHTFSGRWSLWEEWQAQWDSLGDLQKVFGAGQSALGLHNDFLMIMTHGGFLGLAIFIALLVSISVVVLRNALARPTAWNVAAVLLVVLWVVDSIGLVPSAYAASQWFVWGIVGLALRIDRDERPILDDRAARRSAPSGFQHSVVDL